MALACSTSAFKNTALPEALEQVKGLGFDYVDLIGIEGWGHVEPEQLARKWDANAARIDRLLREHELSAVAMNCAVGSLYERSAEANPERIHKTGAIARLMHYLRVGVASFYPGYKVTDRPWDDVLGDTVDTLRIMRMLASENGVEFTVELHKNTPFETMGQCERLLEAVPNLRIAYDPSHFVMQGLDVRETESLLDRTAHVHLRDAAEEKMQVPFGEGDVDFDWILDALAERGYDGHFSIEYLGGADWDVTEDIARLREALVDRLEG